MTIKVAAKRDQTYFIKRSGAILLLHKKNSGWVDSSNAYNWHFQLPAEPRQLQESLLVSRNGTSQNHSTDLRLHRVFQGSFRFPKAFVVSQGSWYPLGFLRVLFFRQRWTEWYSVLFISQKHTLLAFSTLDYWCYKIT